jgi:hypothetical protein
MASSTAASTWPQAARANPFAALADSGVNDCGLAIVAYSSRLPFDSHALPIYSYRLYVSQQLKV